MLSLSPSSTSSTAEKARQCLLAWLFTLRWGLFRSLHRPWSPRFGLSSAVTEVVLDFLYPVLAPEPTPSAPAWNSAGKAPGQASPPTQDTFSLTQDPYAFQNVQFNGGLTSLVSPSPPTTPWAAWTEPDRTVGVGYRIGTVPLRSSEAYRQIGHSIFTLLAAVLGGLFARRPISDSASRKCQPRNPRR